MEKTIIKEDSYFLSKTSYAEQGNLLKKAPLGAELYILIFFGSPLVALIVHLFEGLKNDYFLIYIALVASGISLIFIIIDQYKRNKKGYIDFDLDRLENEIIFPKNIYRNKEYRYDFNRIYLEYGYKRVYYKKDDNQHHLIHIFRNEITDQTFIEDWSFIIWYMDKNRPLPPGEVLDPYRQKDFERRKAEGFPRPLYPSNIPTPEATEQQQKEREQIGGW